MRPWRFGETGAGGAGGVVTNIKAFRCQINRSAHDAVDGINSVFYQPDTGSAVQAHQRHGGPCVVTVCGGIPRAELGLVVY